MNRVKLARRVGPATAIGWLIIAVPAIAAPNLAITVTPSSMSAPQGGTAVYTVKLDPSGGFSGTVSVVVSNLPAGATAAASPGFLVSGNPTTYQHTVNVGVATVPGSYTITFTTAGAIVRSTTATLVVTGAAPTFFLASTPSVRTTYQGTGTTFSSTITSSNGFSGAVAMTASGVPSGTTAVFSPSTVPGGAGTSVLTLTPSAATTPGVYSITITATSGAIVRTQTVTLYVNATGASYSLLSSPQTFDTLDQDTSPQATISLGGATGFSEPVSLSVSGVPAFMYTNIYPPAPSITGSQTFLMTIFVGNRTTGERAPLGTYTLTVTGTSLSGVVKTVNITVRVVSCLPHFVLTSQPTTQTVLAGGTGGYNIVMTRNCGFTGTVAYTIPSVPAGVTATLGTTVALSNGQTVTPLQVAVASSATPGSGTITVLGSAPGVDPGNYWGGVYSNLTIAALSTRHAITAAPTTLSARVGSSATVVVTMTTSGGFRGPITFSTGMLPFDLGASFSPATLDAAGTTTLTLSPGINTQQGTYQIPIVASGSQGARTTSISISILPRAAIVGRVTNSSGAGISGARVEWIRNGVSGGSVTADSSGYYFTPDLALDTYALYCSATGYKTAIYSGLSTQPVAPVTKDFVLPPLPSATAAKEYIYVQNRLVAIDTATDGTPFIDFEKFTGENGGSLPLPPLSTDGVLISGGQLFPLTSGLPANPTVLYGTGGFEWCSGCAATVRVTFAQPVRFAAVSVYNGHYFPIVYTVSDNSGASRSVEIASGFESGAARFSITGPSISFIDITSTMTNSWDFFLDNIQYVAATAGTQAPAQIFTPGTATRSQIDVTSTSKPGAANNPTGRAKGGK